jgi:hypothetical protein
MSRTPQTRIELIVRVSDGSFESSLFIPIESTEAERNEFAKMWIGAMASAFRASWVQPEADGRPA